MVESGGLENRYTGDGIVGSNPTLSSIIRSKFIKVFLGRQTKIFWKLFMNLFLFYQGITIGLAVAIPVGPIALICIKEGLRGSFASTCALALGVSTADAIYAVIGALGLSTINLFLNRFQTTIELVGVAFILYLGISALRHGVPEQAQQECSTGTLIQTYFSTLILTLTSPMTIILFAGIFAGMGSNLDHLF